MERSSKNELSKSEKIKTIRELTILNYKKWIGYILFFIVIFTAGTLLFKNFDISVLIIATIAYSIAIIPTIKKKKE